MRPLTFIKKYSLDQDPSYIDEAAFMKDLESELIEEIKWVIPLNYKTFKIAVREIYRQYNTIINITNTRGLLGSIWTVFYKMYVVPLRKYYFPEINEKIEKRIEQNQYEKYKKYSRRV